MTEAPPVVPGKVAVIMDGNGRWARERGKPRVEGHRVGAESVRVVTRTCARWGVDVLTLYAFSLENFRRPKKEVDFLMKLLARFLVRERREIMDNGIRFRVIGRREMLPSRVRGLIARLEEMSAANEGMKLVLALAYGGRAEIADAARAIAERAARGEIEPGEVNESLLEDHLYDPDVREVDLLIRTAGEMRISNFLLWQISYAEFHVSPVCWPEFREEELRAAFLDFAGRKRKFGGLLPEEEGK